MFANDSPLASLFFLFPLCYLATLNEKLKAVVMMKRKRFLENSAVKPTPNHSLNTHWILVGDKKKNTNFSTEKHGVKIGRIKTLLAIQNPVLASYRSYGTIVLYKWSPAQHTTPSPDTSIQCFALSHLFFLFGLCS